MKGRGDGEKVLNFSARGLRLTPSLSLPVSPSFRHLPFFFFGAAGPGGCGAGGVRLTGAG